MITVLLEQIIQLLTGWIEKFNDHAEAVEDSLTALNNTASDIELNTDPIPDIRDNTGAIITPITQIKTNTDSIKNDVTQIKTDTGIIKNNANSIATSAGVAAAFAEDCATNTLDIVDKVTTIASDTTQIRADQVTLDNDLDKIYEAIKWSLADKYIDETESGPSPITFNTDIADDLKSLKVGLVAQQSGSGDPSPSNERTISGYSSMGLTVNGSSVTIALGDTYYDGYLDVLSGDLIITTILKQITTASAIYTTPNSGTGIRVNNFIPTAKAYKNGLCNMAKVVFSADSFVSGTMAIGVNNRNLYWGGILDILGFTTLAEMETWLTNNAVYVLYERDTPLTVSLTAQQIAAIKGVNTITSDTNGDIEVTYKESVKHYLDKQDN